MLRTKNKEQALGKSYEHHRCGPWAGCINKASVLDFLFPLPLPYSCEPVCRRWLILAWVMAGVWSLLSRLRTVAVYEGCLGVEAWEAVGIRDSDFKGWSARACALACWCLLPPPSKDHPVLQRLKGKTTSLRIPCSPVSRRSIYHQWEATLQGGTNFLMRTKILLPYQ